MTTKHNPDNERIKRHYFTYLKEAQRHSEATIDAVAEALARFEQYTRYRAFKEFHINQAVAFKKFLADQRNARTGEPLSKATQYGTLTALRRFFAWLAGQPGFKSRFQYADADYFNLSERDARVATTRRVRPYPTLGQVRHTISAMPSQTPIERRNRALLAFTILTGCRVSATASVKLKHVDLASRSVFLDAREVRTKFSKTFTVNLFDVGDDLRAIWEGWITELREQRRWGADDPVFPATEIRVGPDQCFVADSLKREHWASSSPIREIFHAAFTAVGLPYFHPHSFRRTLVAWGETVCRTPEEFKAFSQNLGHDEPLTTFTSYGAVSPQRQAEILATLRSRNDAGPSAVQALAQAMLRELRSQGALKP